MDLKAVMNALNHPRELKTKISSDEQRMVWAEVYVPNIPDSQGDFMTEEAVMKMAYNFMRNMNQKKIDVQHNNELVDGACAVESFVARKGDPDFIKGSWVVGVHIPDDATWGRVRKGEINGFSIEALVTGSPSEIEVDIPPVIKGMTSKDEDHEHEFFVSYDGEGKFLGGRTSLVNGHFHVIKHGTVTEEEASHRHKFSYVELLNSLVAVTT